MNKLKMKRQKLARRKRRIRKSVFGTGERPRLTVSRTLANIYAQVVDDDRQMTICQASTMDKELRDKLASGGNKSAAEEVGKLIASRARAAGVEQVVFDRNGRAFHGRVKALADAARADGLKF